VDEWIVGNSPLSGRTYVVHTKGPRFFVEIIDLGNREREAGAMTWIEEPVAVNALHWSKEALDVYALSIEMGRGA